MPPLYRQIGGGNPWQSGFVKRFPWQGISALFGVILCVVASALVLRSSNGTRIDLWPAENHTFQPAVFLALFSALANTLLRFALQEGCAITWWREVIKGKSIIDLHRYWFYGASAKASLTSGKHFNKVALGCLLTTIVVIGGPLLQRGSTITSASLAGAATLSVFLTPDPLPAYFSGFYMTRGSDVNLLTPSFAQVVREFNSNSAMKLNHTGCSGVCNTTVTAAGFDQKCTTTQLPYNISQQSGVTYDVGSIVINFDGEIQSGAMQVYTTFKPSSGCVGQLVATTCDLHIATVRYPITITNDTVTLAARSNTVNDTIESQYPPLELAGLGVWPSTIGGIAFAADRLYSSNVTMYETGILAVEAAGPMSYTYIASDERSYGTCDMFWTDPTADVVAAIRQMTFRSAIYLSNDSTQQTVQATDLATYTLYVSNFAYLSGAVSLMILNTCVLFPLFLGWWHLGRTTSLSPIEVAKAFRAPLLRDSDCNGDINMLLNETGSRKARYGVVNEQGLAPINTLSTHWDSNEEGMERIKRRLEIGSLGSVSTPLDGNTYHD
ncbi:hypothetical protein MMC11_006196 [Xylographa trunciseda]|nr:hypothetical protein [Xylographa trunciseda]